MKKLRDGEIFMSIKRIPKGLPLLESFWYILRATRSSSGLEGHSLRFWPFDNSLDGTNPDYFCEQPFKLDLVFFFYCAVTKKWWFCTKFTGSTIPHARRFELVTYFLWWRPLSPSSVYGHKNFGVELLTIRDKNPIELVVPLKRRLYCEHKNHLVNISLSKVVPYLIQ